MKNIKKLSAVFAALFLMAGVFAEPKSTGLTDSDVKNWAKNLGAIQKEFDKLNLNDESIVTASKKDYAKAESVLQKYGISAPNSVEKYAMINQCSALLMGEDEMGGADAQSMAMMKSMGIDPFAQLRANINSKDYKVVQANKKAVISAAKGYADSIPTDSGTDYGVPDPYAESVAMNKKMAQPKIDDMNKAAVPIKQVYEYLTTGKKAGAGKLLYPTEDKQNASKYKKQKIDAKQLPIEINGYESNRFEQTGGISEEEFVDELTASIDLKKNIATFTLKWAEAEFNKDFDGTSFTTSPIKATQFSKTVKTAIKSAELYIWEKNAWGGISKEFVLATKEGAVIHLWNMISNDGNAYSSRVQFGDIKAPEDTNWYEDNGN